MRDSTLAGILQRYPMDFEEFLRACGNEYLVCTELLSARLSAAYYWSSGNRAELEFLVAMGSMVVPVEVKSCARTSGKSLATYRSLYRPAYAVRFSMKQPGSVTDENGTSFSLPLFAVSCMKRMCTRE